MARLIDDLWDVSLIALGKLELRNRSIDLRSTVEQAIKSCRPAIAAQKHELIVRFLAEPVILEEDSELRAQVFENLIVKACKYTKLNGHIWITLECGDDSALAMKDDGIGIPRDKIDNLGAVHAR